MKSLRSHYCIVMVSIGVPWQRPLMVLDLWNAYYYKYTRCLLYKIKEQLILCQEGGIMQQLEILHCNCDIWNSLRIKRFLSSWFRLRVWSNRLSLYGFVYKFETAYQTHHSMVPFMRLKQHIKLIPLWFGLWVWSNILNSSLFFLRFHSYVISYPCPFLIIPSLWIPPSEF